MNSNFDYWFDSDSSQFIHNDFDQVHSPRRELNAEWSTLLNPDQKQLLTESNQTFPNVKRKYEQRFMNKIESSSSSSYPEDDQLSVDFRNPVNPLQEATIKAQKQQIKRIEQENRFLKQKIDDLSFRLKETQIELNKLKYSGNNSITNYQSMKEACLKQISQLMSEQKGDAPETCIAFKKLKEMTDFDGKLKVDLMNYFMSQLLENIIHDSTFYFIDSILGKKGLWKNSNDQKVRKVDEEFIQWMHLKDQKNYQRFAKDLQESLEIPAMKYKQSWKTFYKSYINLLNQGFIVQNFLRHATQKILTYLPRENFAKLEVYFEKIKLRKDIRSLRQSWFKQIQYDDQQTETGNQINAIKKTKISNN